MEKSLKKPKTKEPNESLISKETMDRSSPELWPELIPGLFDFVSCQTVPTQQPWMERLNEDECNLLHEFGTLTASGLVEEIKKLHNIAYQLGLEEAKEMTRGKYLNIFEKRR